MLIDIYKSGTNGDIFVAVPAGTDISKVNLPNHPDLGGLQPSRTGGDVDRGKSYVGMSGDDVLDQIDEKGYAIFGATVTVGDAIYDVVK